MTFVPFKIAVAVSLLSLWNPHTVVSMDKVQTELLLAGMSFTTQVTDVLSTVLGHTPQPSALIWYEQNNCTGSHWKVSAFLATWDRRTLLGGRAAYDNNYNSHNPIRLCPCKV